MFFKNIVFNNRLIDLFLFCTFGSILLFRTILSESLSGKCGSGQWAQFKNEKCIILIDTTLTQPEAKDLCRSEPHSNGKSRLITMSSAEEQDFISEYLFKLKVKDNLWIDLIRGNDTNPIFYNSHYDELEFSNWAVDRPSSDLKKRCVQMKPPTEGMVSPLKGKGIINGKWEDTLCSRKNLVLCEKPIEWDPFYLQRAVIRGQKQLDSLKSQLRDLNIKTEEMSTEKFRAVDLRLDVVINKLEEFDSQLTQIVNQTNTSIKELVSTQKQLKEQNHKPVPVGFIYMQLPGQSEPKSLWPEFAWKDISGNYAGLFFRVQGNGSAPFLQIQQENSPKLIAVSYQSRKAGNKHIKDEFESVDKWSKEVFAGYGPPDGFDKKNLNPQYLSFKMSSGEVRPINTAIVIWQRVD